MVKYLYFHVTKILDTFPNVLHAPGEKCVNKFDTNRTLKLQHSMTYFVTVLYAIDT